MSYLRFQFVVFVLQGRPLALQFFEFRFERFEFVLEREKNSGEMCWHVLGKNRRGGILARRLVHKFSIGQVRNRMGIVTLTLPG